MKLRAYARKIGISYITAYRHFKSGILKGVQLPTGTIIVEENETKEELKSKNIHVALYARVSSSENKDNLKTQLERLKNYATAKGYIISKEVSEIGSGLNPNRKKLIALLKDNKYDIIIVEHKDRLARFGTELLDIVLNQVNRKIEIINQVDNETEDTIQDLVSIITSFSARIYGQRRSKRKTEQIIQNLKLNKTTKKNAKKETPNKKKEEAKESVKIN
jgi:predicted site-specific integrase-resolvase